MFYKSRNNNNNQTRRLIKLISTLFFQTSERKLRITFCEVVNLSRKIEKQRVDCLIDDTRSIALYVYRPVAMWRRQDPWREIVMHKVDDDGAQRDSDGVTQSKQASAS